MKISIPKENRKGETRVAASPEVVRKFVSMGFSVTIESGAGLNAGFTDEEREGFDNIINAGFIDTFRELHKGNGHYTWWSYMGGARARNEGWRIDYFCISPSLKSIMTDSSILPEVMGSDHCPIVLNIN